MDLSTLSFNFQIGPHQLARLVRGDADSDDCTTNAAAAYEGDLTRHMDVRDVLTFGEEDKMEQNSQ
jgi:hemerythrin-like domain-containing protein